MTLQATKKLTKQHPGQYYTYLLKRPNGIPFYVGKGTCKGGRIEEHRSDAIANRGSNRYRINIIRKIRREGGQVDYEIVSFFNDESCAFDKERELISFYGRINNGTGILVNMTDGGEGVSGRIVSKETRKKISDANKGKIVWIQGKHHSEETKKKMSEKHKGRKSPLKGRPRTEETKKKISESNKGKILSDEHKLNLSKSHIGKPSTRLGWHHSEETKKKLSRFFKGRPSTRIGYFHSEKTKQKMRDVHLGVPLSLEHIASIKRSKNPMIKVEED